ncbi:hypothetical protein D3C86_1367140 [compost metagenome]
MATTALLETKENSTAIKIQTTIMATEVLEAEQAAVMVLETDQAMALEAGQVLEEEQAAVII